MGQTQSNESVPDVAVAISVDHQSAEPSPAAAAAVADDSPPSMETLLAEAAAYGDGDDDNMSLDAKAQKALECPCIANLRSGPCGSQFSESFLCFLKSTAEEKGSDCVNPFIALQRCINSNPNAFPKDVLEDEEVEKEEKPSPEYRILPPNWSLESPPRPKL